MSSLSERGFYARRELREVERDQRPRFLGRCYLCEEDEEKPPVAVCHRCGAFTCREHVVTVVHRSYRKPVGIMSPSSSREEGEQIEMVCEVCRLNELTSARNLKRKRSSLFRLHERI